MFPVYVPANNLRRLSACVFCGFLLCAYHEESYMPWFMKASPWGSFLFTFMNTAHI